MEHLTFDQRKYGRELLIDAVDMATFAPVAHHLVPSFYCLACIREGQGVITLNDEQIPIAPGTVLFISPGTFSEIFGMHCTEAVWLFFEGAFLDTFFQDQFFVYRFDFFHGLFTPSFLQCDPATFAPFYKLSCELHQELNQLDEDSEHVLRASLYLLLTRLNRQYAKTYGTPGNLEQAPLLKRFKQLLAQQIDQFGNVQQLAQALGISTTYLNTLCKKYFGRTAKDVIKEHLLVACKRALRHTDASITEIAYQLHFSDTANFTHFFKARVGITPSAYRKAFQ